VESEIHLRSLAEIVDEGILPGLPGKFQTATHQPLVEAFQPAESTSVVQVDVAGVDDFFDW